MQKAWAKEVIAQGIDPFDPRYVELGIPLPRVLIRKRRQHSDHPGARFGRRGGEEGGGSGGREGVGGRNESGVDNTNSRIPSPFGPDAAGGGTGGPSATHSYSYSNSNTVASDENIAARAALHLPLHSRAILWLSSKMLTCVGYALGYGPNGSVYHSGGSSNYKIRPKNVDLQSRKRLRPAPFLARTGSIVVVPDFGTGVLAMAGDAAGGSFAAISAASAAGAGMSGGVGADVAGLGRGMARNAGDFWSAVGHGPGKCFSS